MGYPKTYYADEVAKIDPRVDALARTTIDLTYKLNYNVTNLNECIAEVIEKAQDLVESIDLEELYNIMRMSFHEHRQWVMDLELKKEMARDQLRRVYLLIIKIWTQEGVIKKC
nr:MAG TPA: hypothetical protein [Caudoviricetes sp.]